MFVCHGISRHWPSRIRGDNRLRDAAPANDDGFVSHRFFDQRPWYFRSAYYAIGFGVLSYLFSGNSVEWSVVAGVFFSVLMTTLDLFWALRRRRKQAREAG